jgi:eukaryotic-like serine/threonine-protein kinase
VATEEQPITREALADGWGGPEASGEAGVPGSSTVPLEVGSGVVASRTSGSLAPGTRVGRYEIIELVGSGGEGRVYRARDPQLERFVALKLLHADTVDGDVPLETPTLLLREARTLAQLSHPNVVAAYDVGVHDGALFVAMEFIGRVSMRDWLAEPRTLAEIVRVLVAAGRGLAAAHAAHVCHRDFKPANVMIASDGRVRVVDFGLARMAHGQPHTGERGEREAASAPRLADAATEEKLAPSAIVTKSALMGTPGFMAPEQLRGQPADERSDQFSYAVTAFLALTGGLPHVPASEPHPGAPAPRSAPWPPQVPHRLRRVVARGLMADPARRYPSLAAMVTALEAAAAPRRPRIWALAIGAGAVSVSLGATALVTGQPERPQCNLDASAFTGVWDAARRSAVERAFQATGRSSHADAFVRVAQRLDAFRDEWPRLRREACEASQPSESVERVSTLRTACLDAALAGAKTLVDALGRVSADDIDRVAGASPPALRACNDASALKGTGELPPPERQAEVAEVERQIAGVSALIIGGFRSEALEQARLALERARATGHAPTIAKATVYMGRSTIIAARSNEERSAGEAWVKEGMRLAAYSGQELLLARTASHLFCNLSYVQVRVEEAEAMLPMVQAIVARVGNPVEPRIEMLMGTGRIEIERRRFPEAIAAFEEARRLAPSAEGETANYGFLAGRDLSQIRMELGQFAAAVPAAQETVDGIRRVYGPSHPRMLFGLADLAVAQARAGQRDAAVQSIADARQIATTLPADEPRLKNVARAEGLVYEHLGECERALGPLREAMRLFTASQGATHPLTSGVLAHYATCLAATGRTAEAIAAREQTLSNARSNGAASRWVADQAFGLAKLLWPDPKQRPRAQALIDEANSIWRKEGATQPMEEAASWLAAQGR